MCVCVCLFSPIVVFVNSKFTMKANMHFFSAFTFHKQQCSLSLFFNHFLEIQSEGYGNTDRHHNGMYGMAAINVQINALPNEY